MTSRRSYERISAAATSLSMWGGGLSSDSRTTAVEYYSEDSDTGQGQSHPGAGNFGDNLLDKFRQAQSIGSPFTMSRTSPDLHTIREESINYLFLLLFGKGNLRLSRLTGNPGGLYASPASGQGFGGSYTEYRYQAEQENTSFSTTGTVKTADGREISFQLSMVMSRSFEEAYGGTVNFGSPQTQAKLCDPLVINLNTSSASVSDQTFYFDLDQDGTLDKISRLSAGSGFLALDKNGDGIINDGSELFGTTSGDGFADLAEYDEDGNGWIDENDPIFDKLRIWTKDARGRDVLCAIGKAGVGAIYLGNAQTEFSLNSTKSNATNALVQKTGIFLYENGSCGTVQHLDMAKQGT